MENYRGRNKIDNLMMYLTLIYDLMSELGGWAVIFGD